MDLKINVEGKHEFPITDGGIKLVEEATGRVYTPGSRPLWLLETALIETPPRKVIK